MSFGVRVRLRSLPGVLQARTAVEHVVTPGVKADIARLADDVASLRAAVDDLEGAMTDLLGAISMVSGRLEVLRRQLNELEADDRPSSPT